MTRRFQRGQEEHTKNRDGACLLCSTQSKAQPCGQMQGGPGAAWEVVFL